MCDVMEVTIESDAPGTETFPDGSTSMRICPERFQMIANALHLVPEAIAKAMQDKESAAVYLNLEAPTVWVPEPNSEVDQYLRANGYTYRVRTVINRPSLPDPDEVEVPDTVPEWLINPDQLPPF